MSMMPEVDAKTGKPRRSRIGEQCEFSCAHFHLNFSTLVPKSDLEITMMKIARLAVLVLLSMLQWPTHGTETAIQLDADEPFSQAAPPPAAAQRAMVSSMSECHAVSSQFLNEALTVIWRVPNSSTPACAKTVSTK